MGGRRLRVMTPSGRQSIRWFPVGPRQRMQAGIGLVGHVILSLVWLHSVLL